VILHITNVRVWRMHKEAFNPEFLVPAVIPGGGSVTIWAAISLYSAGSIITVNGQITASDCMDILGVWMCPIVIS
jgi:hypothetical protein